MRECFACGARTLSPRREHGRALFARSLGEFAQLWGCMTCDHKQFVPEFPVEKLADVYAHYYTTEDERAAYGSHYSQPAEPYLQFAERIAELAREYGLKPGARIHEFGCGAGITVHVLRQMGFDATGSDWSPGAVSFAHENGNAHIRQEDMTTLGEWSEPVDMVLNLHAIEHVPRPVDVLKGFARIMGPRSLLYLNTNQGASIVNNRFGMHFDSWYYYPQHLHYFSPRSFEKIAARAELKPLLIGTTDRTFDQTDAAEPNASILKARMEGQEMEMLCARAESPHKARKFSTPDPWPTDDAPFFDHDSHADWFKPESPWRYWAGDPLSLEPVAEMVVSDQYEQRYFSPAYIGDCWVQGGLEKVPVLEFVSPQSGVAVIEVRAALQYAGAPAWISLDAPGWARQGATLLNTAPKTVTVQAKLAEGDRVRIATRCSARVILMAGVRWLSVFERASIKAKRIWGAGTNPA